MTPDPAPDQADRNAMPGSASDRDRLAARQAALVAALVAGAADPAGFDPDLLAAARDALLRKRAGEVARAWPLLAAGLGGRWSAEFRAFAAGRPPAGPLRDGWDLARLLARRGELTGPAAAELAERERAWSYDGAGAPRPRRVPGGRLRVLIAGRMRSALGRR
jgi:hypothetical protein